MNDVNDRFRQAFRKEFSRRAMLALAGRSLVGAGMLAATLTADGRPALAARAPRGGPVLTAQGMQTPASQILMGPLWTDSAGWDQPQYYETIRLGDINGDGYPELIGRTAGGIHAYKFDRKPSSSAYFDDSTGQWKYVNASPILTDAKGWYLTGYYNTIDLAEVNKDGSQELMARGADGLHTYSFTDAGGWQEIGNVLTDLSDAAFSSPHYYETIQFGDVDNDGADEMIARNKDGLMTYKFDGTNWKPIAPLFTDLSDGGGWNLPEYYRTLRLARLSSTAPASLFARYSDGIHVLQYNPGGWTYLYNVAGQYFSDSGGWNRPEYYETIQVVDIDNDTVAEVVGRGSNGIVWVKADKAGQPVIPTGLMPDAGGWASQSYYDTIRYGDIDGDAKVEIIYRSGSGMAASRWSALNNGFDTLTGEIPLSDADGWSQVQYYSTIRCADIDGRGQTEIVVRGPLGIQTWRYDAQDPTPKWKTTAVQAFPDFSQGDLSLSYQAVKDFFNNKDSISDIRAVYDQTDGSVLKGYANSLFNGKGVPNPTAPPGIDPNLFTAVVQQIRSELLSASKIAYYYHDSSQSVTAFMNSVYFNGASLRLDGLATQLEVDSKSDSAIWITIAQALVAAALALASIVAPPLGAAAFAGLFGAGAALLPLADSDSGVKMAYGILETNLGEALTGVTTQNALLEQRIFQDYGLLIAQGGALNDGGGGKFFTDDEFQNLIIAAQNGFLLWAWQQLTPYTWRIDYVNDFSPPSGYDGPFGRITQGPNQGYYGSIGLQGSVSGNPSNSVMAQLFDQPTDNPSGMGVSGQDVLDTKGPWYQIPYHSNPLITQPAPPIPAHRIVIEAQSLVRNASGSVTATLRLTNRGGNPETNVMVTGAKLNRKDTLHSLPTRHQPFQPGQSRIIIRDFPASVGSKGTNAALQISGKYAGGSFGGSLRVKLP